MNLIELAKLIKVSGLNPGTTTELIEKYFNSDRFTSLDAEVRNRQIEPTRQGLKFHLLKNGFNERKVDSVLRKSFSGLANRIY